MSNQDVLVWIFIGIIVGTGGRFAMPRQDPGGFIVTILLGIAGALLGGFVARAWRWDISNVVIGWGCAGIGSIALLVLYRVVMQSRMS